MACAILEQRTIFLPLGSRRTPAVPPRVVMTMAPRRGGSPLTLRGPQSHRKRRHSGEARERCTTNSPTMARLVALEYSMASFTNERFRALISKNQLVQKRQMPCWHGFQMFLASERWSMATDSEALRDELPRTQRTPDSPRSLHSARWCLELVSDPETLRPRCVCPTAWTP